jgi:hypothetical protein
MSDSEPDVPPVPLPPVAPAFVAPVAPQYPVAPPSYGATGYPAPGYGAPGYPAPGYAQPGGYAALPPVQPKGLAIASLILGIGAIAFFFLLLSLPVGIAAIITGHLAQRRQPYARGLWITGLITGYAGIALGVLAVIGFIVFFAVANSYTPY